MTDFKPHPEYGYGFAGELKATDHRIERYKKQREDRGFDNTELWNLDTTIARFILPRLKAYKDINDGYPGNLTRKKWYNIMDKMIAAFEILTTEDAVLPQGEDRDKIITDGLKLFSKYFRGLWI